MNLSVDVISDVICPWCFIGKRRLEMAIAAHDGQVKVRWLPFQLNPTMPKAGVSRRDYRIKKFGSWERSLELDAQMVAVGESEGIHFAFDRTERTPNTLDAHRLIWLADQQGCQDARVAFRQANRHVWLVDAMSPEYLHIESSGMGLFSERLLQGQVSGTTASPHRVAGSSR